ncbi:nicotinate (nicotinamide) nucleotide adenylyltransferase [Sulfurimonas sp. SAG-AH-194-I05]|nr:nicotinate (nicotinamide) nucleotide adenylyltransferase [Sulfurimonas sp. SAG-AH-194-I05]MDF1874985.1 nicotinate (nicotinamide) nucleotide adenylyltransferase [Sulfurimonas sp. SAG-AH-194-I05]
MKTIALFGGSFDPPHIAHEEIVKEVLKINDIDKVVLMPTFLNPFKSHSFAPSKRRLQWLEKIFHLHKDVEICNYEVTLAKKVSTISSVKYLLQTYKKVYLIIGADNVASLKKWDNYEELKTLVTFIIATRDGIKIPPNYMKLHIKENISSTELRANMNEDKLSHVCSKEIIEFYKE